MPTHVLEHVIENTGWRAPSSGGGHSGSTVGGGGAKSARMTQASTGERWGDVEGGGWDSTAKALIFPFNEHLSLQGYEGSLIKLTSRQVISLQGFSSSPDQLLSLELSLLPFPHS